jgi:hypothetical protein
MARSRDKVASKDEGEPAQGGSRHRPLDEIGEANRILEDFSQELITSDQVKKRLAALYQRCIGGPTRTLIELDEQTGLELAALIAKRSQAILAEHGAVSPPAEQLPEPNSAERLKAKSKTVLRREQVLLTELTKTNEEVSSARLLSLVHAHDETVSEAAVIAHLDRLLRAGLIARERKGLYRRSSASRSYLDSLTRELEARPPE